MLLKCCGFISKEQMYSFEIKNMVVIIGFVSNFMAHAQCDIHVLCCRCVVIYTADSNLGGRSAGQNIKGSAECGENS
jgi:hypothetical protein